MRYFLLLALVLFLGYAQAPPDDKEEMPPKVTPPLGQRELHFLDLALSLNNMTVRDLGFRKDYAPDPNRLKVVDITMREPLELPRIGDELGQLCAGKGDDLAPILIRMMELLDIDTKKEVTREIEDEIEQMGAKDETLAPFDDASGFLFYASKEKPLQEIANHRVEIREALARLYYAMKRANDYRNDAFKNITDKELQRIIYTAPIHWFDEGELDEYNLRDAPKLIPRRLLWLEKEIDKLERLSEKELLDIEDRVDWQSLVKSGLYHYIGVSLFVSEMRRNDLIAAFSLVQKTEYETPLGKIILSGSQDNLHGTTRDLLALIDFGGDDIYRDATSCPSGSNSFLLSVIDFGGNDTYLDTSPFAQGGALLGSSVLFDLGGDDIYNAQLNSQGATMFGTGLLFDSGGNDTYRSDQCSQGSATFGLAILRDGAGRDDYYSTRFAQGFGSVRAFGILSDGSGNDSYFASGKYLHAPLYADRFQSLSQGFGFGWRGSSSGGIGLLYDGLGNDNYYTEIYGQGSSYWYALGMLVDDEGNDAYTSIHYSQGAGIHLSSGLLLDRAGHDTYQCPFGPSQGGGHDLAVGILIDMQGNDYYSSQGIGQGQGNANGLGILIDSKGQDSYMGRLADSTQGTGNAARGYGSIGIFLDLDEMDTYSVGGGKNNSIWTKGYWGAGIDTDDDFEKREGDEK